ncbi:hypothetical protein FNJ87_09125, partial [Nonlabens mediterrranea]|nr:hypothetical protein [Nonlabens mediterrranea]
TFAPLVSDPLDGLIAYNRSSSTGTGLYLWENRWKRFLTTDDIDIDWHEAGTTSPPNNINDDIVTSGSVGIGGTSITTDASLDLSADDNGFMVNRVTLTNAGVAGPISSPAEGMLVYNDTENLSPTGYLNDVRVGFYAWQNGRWVAQKTESRSARFGNAANRTQNLNDFTANELELFAFNEWNDDTNLYDVIEDPSTTRLTIGEDGRYKITVGMSIIVDGGSTNVDIQLDAELRVNRSGSTLYPGTTTSNNYMRNRNGTTTSSINLNETIELQDGDEVYIHVERTGNSGTVTMRPEAGSNFFTIEKIK